MTKQSFLDEAIKMVRDLDEFKRSGSKEAFRRQLREGFVPRTIYIQGAEQVLPPTMIRYISDI